MPKFFTDSIINDSIIIITGDDANHIKTVLRAEIGRSITVCDKKGYDYICNIKSINKNDVELTIIEKHQVMTDPKIKITLFQGMPKADKLELIIQKTVELGIFEIVPVITKNTIVKMNEKSDKKIERYNKISESAAKQCGRGIVPKVLNPISFIEAVDSFDEYDLFLVAYEKEVSNKINHIISNFNGERIAIFIGPEGGFSLDEIETLDNKNIIQITLGKRILRTETAGFVALTILMHYLDEI